MKDARNRDAQMGKRRSRHRHRGLGERAQRPETKGITEP